MYSLLFLLFGFWLCVHSHTRLRWLPESAAKECAWPNGLDLSVRTELLEARHASHDAVLRAGVRLLHGL